MSAFDSLLDRLQRAYSKISEIEAVASAHPSDLFVLSNLSEMKRHASDLEREWEDESRYAQKEVCRYRILPSQPAAYHIRQVAQSLETFQDLFSQIYDATVNKIRSRARFSDEIAQKTAFNLGFTYPGSLGVAMTIDGTSDLFEGEYDAVVKSFLKVMKLENEGDVRSIAEQFGLAVVRRTYEWSKVNANSAYGIDVGWLTSMGHRLGTIAGPDDFRRNVNLISMISDVERLQKEVYGTLVGIDTKAGRFRFVQINEGPDYSGGLSETFPVAAKWAVNVNYIAVIDIESTTSYATQETKSTYRLRELRTDQNA
jgi:hypothetical protein